MRKNHSLALAIMFISLTGCMPDSLTKYQIDPVVPTPSGTTAGQTNFVDLQYFALTNETTGSKYSIFADKATSGVTTFDCSIVKSEITAVSDGITNGTPPYNTDGVIGSLADVVCYINADELELYRQGLKIKLQVPAGICNYALYDHYYFFKHKYRSSTQEAISVTNTVYKSGDGCETVGYVPADVTNATPLCSGDYSGGNPAGPNCDDGAVTVYTSTTSYTGSCTQALIATQLACTTTNSWDTGTSTCSNPVLTASGQTACETVNKWVCTVPGAPVITSKLNQCGGKIGNCLEGPAVSSEGDQSKNSANWPRQMVIDADDGFEKTWTFPSGSTQAHYTNLYLANYTNQCATTNYVNQYSDEMGGTTDNLTSFADDTSKGALWPADNYYDPMKGANPFYTYACLDQDFEYIGRIRLIVRDWNVRFVKAADTDILSRTNDVTKMDKVGMEPGGITPYNDYDDWDDLTAGGTCDINQAAMFNFPAFGL